MPDRLTGIEVFVSAIRAGGISAAARALNISPAMATKHLDALEDRLGVKLMHRTTRRLLITEAGRRFFDRSEALLLGLSEAEEEAASAVTVVKGLLRVAVPVSFGVMHVAPLIAGFTSRFPNLTVELGFNDRRVDVLEEGWDAAVRIGRLADESLIARKIAPATMVVVASPAYLAERGVPRTLDDLSSHNCLGYTLSAELGPKNWHFGADGEIEVPVKGNLHADNGDALIAAAVAGQGLVYGPRFIAYNALRDGLLTVVALNVPLMGMGAIYSLTHPSRRLAAKTRAWTEYLSEALGPRMGDF